MADNSKVISHRCENRPDGYGIRYLTSKWRPDGWFLMNREYNYDWDSWSYWPIAKISFCPFCGENLEEPKQKQNSCYSDRSDCFECSECGFFDAYAAPDDFNYCPSCG